MDGNRRFAKKHGLPNLSGHEAGAKKIIEVCKFAKKENIWVYPTGLIATIITTYLLYITGYLGLYQC